MEVVSNILLEQGTDDKLEQEEGSFFSFACEFFFIFYFFCRNDIELLRGVKANLLSTIKKQLQRFPALKDRIRY